MKIYAIVEKDEDSSVPVIDSNLFMTEDEANAAYQRKIQELCNMDADCPIDESELDNIEIYSTGAITVLDACGDSDNLITLYLISINLEENK